MKTILKAYKFDIRPDKEQKVLLSKHFGCARFIYNYFLNHRKKQYITTGKSDNYYGQAKLLTELKKLEEYDWLREVSSQCLQQSLRNLETAYTRFFAKQSNFPKFKSKKKKNSFTVVQDIKLIGDRIKIPKFKKPIKIIMHREVHGEIKSVTLSLTHTGRYYVSVLVEQEHKVQKHTGKTCGIDLGLKDLVITSDSQRYKNPKHTKKYEIELAKAQRRLARKQKGSNGRERQRLVVAKIHEKILNTRNDNLHKISRDLVNNYDVICVEDLNVKGMVKNRKLSKHISDASWGSFVRMLEYKADWDDKQLIRIGRFFPSSKTCGECGWVNQNLTLSDRNWQCPNGHILDRDINAAKNIMKEGLREIGAGLSDYTDGGHVRPSVSKAVSDEVRSPLL